MSTWVLAGYSEIRELGHGAAGVVRLATHGVSDRSAAVRGTGLELLRRQHERAALAVDELPEPVRDLAHPGLAKDPEERPADAAEFLVELERAATAGYQQD